MPTLKLPTLRDVTADVLYTWQNFASVEAIEDIDGMDGETPYMDVRLAVSRDRWALFSGLGDYDQWHGEVCGAESLDLTARPTRAASERIARDLLAQCRDQLSQLEG